MNEFLISGVAFIMIAFLLICGYFMFVVDAPPEKESEALAWYIFFIATLVVFGYVGARVSSEHDKKIMEQGDRYAACIEAQYHMSPSGYYQKNGQWPECEK